MLPYYDRFLNILVRDLTHRYRLCINWIKRCIGHNYDLLDFKLFDPVGPIIQIPSLVRFQDAPESDRRTITGNNCIYEACHMPRYDFR